MPVGKGSRCGYGHNKANSAIVHAGYDAKYGTLKGKLNVRGNVLMDQVTRAGVPFKRIGSLVLAFSDQDLLTLRKLYENGVKNGVPGLKLLDRHQVMQMEPNVSKKVKGALHAPTAGIVCPYELAAGAVENAVENGTELKLECQVQDIKKIEGGFVLATSQGDIKARFVVNAAGLYADLLSAMVNGPEFQIRPRKGEYLLLDKSQGNVVNSVIFMPPTEKGKGILVTPTVDGNLLAGPTAVDVSDREDLSVTHQA